MPKNERTIRASALRLRTGAHDIWDWLDEQCQDLAALRAPAESAPFSLQPTA